MKRVFFTSGFLLTIFSWILFVFISYCSEANKCTLLILGHIVFLFLFISLSLLIYIEGKNEQDFEKELKREEYERKEKWEKHQYDLYKEEREAKLQYEHEKGQYERAKAFIKELGNKEITEENKLKEDIEKLREDVNALKEEKEKQLLVDVSNLFKKK